MKKLLKILGVFLIVVIAILLIVPFAFEDKIIALIKDNVNKNLEAELNFKDADLSLLSSFPKASVSIEELALTNFAPFKGDTLVSAKGLSLKMGIMELFKDASEAIKVNSITIDEAFVNIQVDSLGNANYDIAKKDETSAKMEETTGNGSFVFDIDSYEITNSRINYHDQASDIFLMLTDFNHSGKGSFSEAASTLDTKTTTVASFGIGGSEYLSNNTIDLDALIDMDLENGKYSFLENQMIVNQLPLKFDGYVDVNETNQEVDISFVTPSSEFKNFLAVIPKEYSKNIENVSTQGDFKLSGTIKGVSDDTHIPKLDIRMSSNNASFKYPDLPKTVRDITIDAMVKNESGLAKDTYVNINTLNFKIDADEFASSAKISQLTENMRVSAKVKGKLNLENISKAYPIELENGLKGTVIADLSTAFDMNAIENNNYERIKNSGTATVSDFIYTSKDIVNPIEISKATIDFASTNFELKEFNAISGKSDIAAKGSINNLYGYLFSDKKLQGNFDINSNSFAVSDFMVEEEGEANSGNAKTSEGESLKIPAFLDVTLNTNAKTVYYDNLTLKDVSGTLLLKDEKATLKNVSSKLFDGTIVVNGNVSTQEKTPTFDMDLGVAGFDIAQSFTNMELLKSLAPIGGIIQGKLNTSLQLSGKLDEEFSPQLNSVTGDALAEILANSIQPQNAKVLSSLTNNLTFLDSKKLNLQDLKTKLTFKDGKVSVSPFNIKYDDIDIQVAGSHGFDKSMDYKMTLNVPAKYMGSEVSSLLAQIGDSEAEKLTVPVVANITGSFTDPTVKTDVKSAVGNLTKQLVEIQKQKLKDKGSNLLKDLITGNQNKNDSIKKTNTTDAVKNILGNVLGGNKKATDSTKTDTTKVVKDPVKDAAENALKNLFGKKKKKKDSV